MRLLMAVAILIAFNGIVILAQQPDKQSLKPTGPVPTGVSASDTPQDVASLQLLAPHFTLGQPQANNLIIRPSSQSTEPVGRFVVMNGAVYMRVPGDQSLVPISGGGASGCFSLDLPQRIKKLEEFIPKLSSLEKGNPQPY